MTSEQDLLARQSELVETVHEKLARRLLMNNPLTLFTPEGEVVIRGSEGFDRTSSEVEKVDRKGRVRRGHAYGVSLTLGQSRVFMHYADLQGEFIPGHISVTGVSPEDQEAVTEAAENLVYRMFTRRNTTAQAV